MSEEKQLTVAEILARAQKENPEAGTRRRRRRSLEEGGVSVAELTGSIKKVEARPVEARHSSVPIDAPEEVPKEVPKKVHAPKAPVTGSSRIAAKAEPVKAEPVKPAPATTEGKSDDETAVIRKVDAPEPAPAAPAAPVERVERPEPVETVETAEPIEEELLPAEEIVIEEDTVNPIILVLLIFAGVVAGVLAFLAFQWIWANTPMAVAIILGIVAVAAAAAGVRAMRTGRDGLTMTLAGLAAAVAAFGPALL